MKRWFRDTLFLRFFVLMWVALVVSHFLAFSVVTSGLFGKDFRRPELSLRNMPTFPSPPPGAGWLGDGLDPPPRFGGGGGGGGEGVAGGPPPSRMLPMLPLPRLPLPLLVLDYVVRLLVIGVAAALGARWLATPMRRLVDASGSLGASLGGASALPRLDESAGAVEVREAARVFNRMAQELDAQFKSRGLLMAALSHDLKTPLTRMRMRLEADASLPFVQRCIADIREMTELVETALDVFRNAGIDEPVQAVDVHALLQSMTDDLGEAGKPVGLAGEAAVAKARPIALRRVVANLLDNAIRYGGRADVAVRRTASEVVVTIDDAGPGIAPELLEAVFQPFFRIEASRNRSHGGNGLGLYIARDLLRRQGGELVIANRPGGGLRAELVLPRS